MRGYAWAFAAALANASQDNLRKLASNRVKNPIEIVALSELFNVSVLAGLVWWSGKMGVFSAYLRRGELMALAAAACRSRAEEQAQHHRHVVVP